GDKFLDLILPPQRGSASGTPMIYLGDGKGNWNRWTAAKWPIRIDYGGVAAGDFNKDKKMDLAFAIHLQGLLILTGDGKGNFNIDKYPDFIGSSMYYNAIHNLFLSTPDAAKYVAYDDPQALVIPGRATYHAVTAGPFSSKTMDDAVVASVRRWPPKLDPKA